MVLHEYGDADAPKMLALHPMGITGENLYQALSPHLTRPFCVLAPDQGGHGDSGPYQSFEDEVDTLKEALLEKGYTQFRLLYGASMGVTVAYEMLKDPAFHFEKVWFDGGGFVEQAPHFQGGIEQAMRLVLKVYRWNPDVITRSFAKNYGPRFAPIMRRNFLHMEDEDIVRIFISFSSRSMQKLPAKTQANMHLEWGENDANYKRSKKALKKYMPKAPVTLRGGCGHCEYMAKHTAAYVRDLEHFIF